MRMETAKEKKVYHLLATDMDGTVLNSEKQISPRNRAAIEAALAQGKQVLFATGRCPTEVREFRTLFPNMRYGVYLSGALVRDEISGRALVERAFSRELAEEILDAVGSVDAMVAVFAGDDVHVESRCRDRLDYFHCACYQDNLERNGVWMDNIRDVLDRGTVYKINFYCHTRADWQKAMERLSRLDVVCSQGSYNNVEVTTAGTDKGKGLAAVCTDMGVTPAEAIAVGDEDNDIAMIRAAGLGVAMANASAEVREIANARTGDCDHDGVAMVIEKYLL